MEERQDLINRQAAINVIREMPPELFSAYQHNAYIDKQGAMIRIMAMPSVQSKIIRCGECKHQYTEGENVVYNMCELNHNKVQSDDWFCGDAERREE